MEVIKLAPWEITVSYETDSKFSRNIGQKVVVLKSTKFTLIRPSTAKATNEIIFILGEEVLTHPACSPDLVWITYSDR